MELVNAAQANTDIGLPPLNQRVLFIPAKRHYGLELNTKYYSRLVVKDDSIYAVCAIYPNTEYPIGRLANAVFTNEFVRVVNKNAGILSIEFIRLLYSDAHSGIAITEMD